MANANTSVNNPILQAKELQYLERKVSKLSAASNVVKYVSGIMFALAVCLVNMYLMIHVCDEPIRLIAMKNPVVKGVFDVVGSFLKGGSLQAIIFSLIGLIILLYIVPITISIFAKWISFIIAPGTSKTNVNNPTQSTLASDANRIYNMTLQLEQSPGVPGTVSAVVCYVVSAIPFVMALFKADVESGYRLEECFGLLLWVLLVLLAVYLLGFPFRAIIKKITGNSPTGFIAYRLSNNLALPTNNAPSSSEGKTSGTSKNTGSYTSSKSSSYTSSNSSNASVNKHDSFTWTASYVRANESQCSDMLLSMLEVSKELLAEGDDQGAANGFARVVIGLELMTEVDAAYYTPPLYANAYALSRIAAFGLKDTSMAKKFAELACKNAQKCISLGGSHVDVARRDYRTMRDFADALSSGSSYYSLKEEWGWEYPGDIINKN